MLEIQSKLTSQGQVSIPAAVRTALGVQPGATISWTVIGNNRVQVSRHKKFTNEDIHQFLFPNGFKGKAKTDEEIKQGAKLHVLKKFSRKPELGLA